MNIFTYLYRVYQRERAIRTVRTYLSQKAGQPISREQVLAAHKRWQARNYG